MIYITNWKSPAGELLLGCHEGRICLCDWKNRKARSAIDKRIQTALESGYKSGICAELSQLQKQLEEYFSAERQNFDVPLLTAGTDFQKAVWTALTKIPYGRTRTYTELAAGAGHPAAVRAAGTANGANALSILIPCHRVVGQHSAGGYAGGPEAKHLLLKLEAKGQ